MHLYKYTNIGHMHVWNTLLEQATSFDLFCYPYFSPFSNIFIY